MQNASTRGPARAALLGALCAATSCGSADTVLQVLLDSSGAIPGITQVEVDVSIGAQRRSYRMPDPPGSVVLPASFTIQIGAGTNGPVTVQVVALGGGTPLATGVAMLPSLRTGSLNTLTVWLPPTVPGMDGGSGDAGAPDGTPVDASVDTTTAGDASALDGAAADAMVMPDAMAMPDTMAMPDAMAMPDTMAADTMATPDAMAMPDVMAVPDTMAADTMAALDAPEPEPDTRPAEPDTAQGEPDAEVPAPDADEEPDAEDPDADGM